MIQDTKTLSSMRQGSEGAISVPPRLDAEALFRGSPVVLIEFQGERYQLRRTRYGKLILTK